ncbi:mucin-19 [Ischnura elegans]|uniref:mucin-19 n=1 Tax=Ischnura elegans TaxID=197161 RepID=UPI001ED89D9D|nr:mucin-19 [Ischnura elegans]XP_046393936.1 mucin-19 [Ischnura elegans]XP_046393937.1 mucin-19 [Ischnura elegans]
MGSLMRCSVEPGTVVPGPRPLLLLRRCLAIQLQRRRKGAPPPEGPPHDPSDPPPPSEFWMYDSGYLLFQSFLEANLKCFWNPALREAVRGLEFRGYVHPGVLLVASPAHGDACLDRIRNAWARNVLKPPADHAIAAIGDMEELAMVPIVRGSFTPLPEALCWVVLELTSAGEAASLPAVRAALGIHFPGIKSPSESVIYDALAALMVDGKVYQTANGYFVVTPESKRRSTVGMVMPGDCPSPSIRHSKRSSPRPSICSSSSFAPTSTPAPPSTSNATAPSGGNGGSSRYNLPCPETSLNGPTPSTRSMLMSMDEAMAKVHGEMETVREGHITHQAVQTNLADVICGGNANDKVLYGRISKPSASAGGGRPRSNSLRFFGSKRRATSASSLVGGQHSSPSPPPSSVGVGRHRRSASLRLYPSSCASLSYSSSSSTTSSSSSSHASPLSDSHATPNNNNNKKGSLLSRLFRRTGSLSWKHKRNDNSSNGKNSGNANLPTFSAQFPPAEWFNPSVAHLHSVATQTRSPGPTSASSPPSPAVRTKLARSQGSLPSLSQRVAPPPDQVPHPPSSVASSRRASTLPRPRNRHRSGGSIAPSSSTDKGATLVVPQMSRAPNSSPPSVITTSSRRSLASTAIPSPSSGAPSTITSLSRSPRHSSEGYWANRLNGTATPSSKNSPSVSGRSNVSREPEKMRMTSNLATPPAVNGGGKGSVVTLQVSSRTSPGSNYSVSVNGTTIPPNSSLPKYSSHFGTTTTTTMTSVTSPGDKQMVNGSSMGGIKSRTEVSVEARQVLKPVGGLTRMSQSPVKSVVRLEGDGHHLVVLNNVGDTTTVKTPEKINEGKPTENGLLSSPVSKVESLKRASPMLIPNGSTQLKTNLAESPGEKLQNGDKDLTTVVGINGNGLRNGEKSPSEESVGGSSDTSVGTGPFENGITLMEFKSLAAQRILQGLSANSIDTLVEVNMAAAARKADSGADVPIMPPSIGTNYDLTVHTDFGMV